MFETLVVVGVVAVVGLIVAVVVVVRCCPNPLDEMDTEFL